MIVVAIDGPAASGKGTLARRLAKELDYAHLDTGALYRVVGKFMLDHDYDPGDGDLAAQVARNLKDTLSPEMLSDPDLRSDGVGQAASMVSVHHSVRDALLDFQRYFAHHTTGVAGTVLDGRDIGTVVCPDADVKLYVTADIRTRADRRLKELQSRGITVKYDAVLADMQERDARDSSREAAPMKPAKDAFILDSSVLSEDAVLHEALDVIRARTNP